MKLLPLLVYTVVLGHPEGVSMNRGNFAVFYGGIGFLFRTRGGERGNSYLQTEVRTEKTVLSGPRERGSHSR